MRKLGQTYLQMRSLCALHSNFSSVFFNQYFTGDQYVVWRIDGEIVIVCTIKKIRYYVVGPFHHLVNSFA